MSPVDNRQLDFVVTVKAYPAVGIKTGEAVCVAGVSAGSEPEWVRLFPVPFRDLPEAMQFKKWQRIKVEVRSPRNDLRPESWSPVISTFEVVDELPAGDWAHRRRLIDSLPLRTMCEMNRLNKLVPGRDQSASSLAVIRARDVPRFSVELRPSEDIAAARAKQNQGQLPISPLRTSRSRSLSTPSTTATSAWTSNVLGTRSRSSTGRSRRPIADGAAPTRATGRSVCAAAGSMTSGQATVTPGCSSGTNTNTLTASWSSGCSGPRTRPRSCRASSGSNSGETRATLLNCFDHAGAVTRVVFGFEAQDSYHSVGTEICEFVKRRIPVC